MCPQCILTQRCCWLEMIHLFQLTCADKVSPQHISLQCPSLGKKVLLYFSHQKEVSLHGRGVPGCQLQDVALFDELIRGVNYVLLLTEHLVYLYQLLQVLLNEDRTFMLVGCWCVAETVSWFKTSVLTDFRMALLEWVAAVAIISNDSGGKRRYVSLT